jgi:superfamily II DNA/RNA helicase
VAGRGIDVPEIDLVINICLPNDVEDFIHRCGRTARGDKSGTIVTILEESEHKKYDFIIKKCNKTSQLFEQNDQKYLMENFKQSVVGLVKNLENVQLENKIVSNEIKNILIEKFGEQELFEKLLMEHLNKNLGKKLNQISQFFEQQALLQENEDKEEIMEKVEEKADDFHFPKYYENPNNIYVDIPSEYLPKCLIIRINSQIAQSDLEEFMIINKIKYSSFEIQRDRVVILFANKYDCQYAFFKISRFNYKGVTGEVSYKKNRGLQRNLQKNLDNF